MTKGWQMIDINQRKLRLGSTPIKPFHIASTDDKIEKRKEKKEEMEGLNSRYKVNWEEIDDGWSQLENGFGIR